MGGEQELVFDDRGLPHRLRKYKTCLLGSSGAGKTALIRRARGDAQPLACGAPTIGCEFDAHLVRVASGQRVKLLVWDTAGQETFRAFTGNFLRGARAVVYVYDATSRVSFAELAAWRAYVAEASAEPRCAFVVAAKCEDAAARRVSEAEGRAAVREFGAAAPSVSWHYAETSAATGWGVSELLERLATALLACDPDEERRAREEDAAIAPDDGIVSLIRSATTAGSARLGDCAC